MRAPNFFVLGGPKCGTTAMCSYLAEHPDVFMARKEIHFFAEGIVRLREAETWDQYLQLFSGARPHHRIVGDASVYYLFARAGERIRQRAPEARLLAMVRNPIEVVQSLHQQLLYSHNEDEQDLETAWRLQRRRAAGERIPATCFNPATLQYARVAEFGAQLRDLYDVFDPQRVHVVVHDDFEDDPRACYEGVLRFLELPLDGRVSFPRVNVRKRDRVRSLGRLLKRSPFGVWRRFKRLTGIEARFLKRALLRLNTVPVEPEPIRPVLHREMLDRFEPDIDLLARVLDRDLSAWKLGPGVRPDARRPV